MEEVKSFLEIVADIGIPVLITLIIIYAVLKLVPVFASGIKKYWEGKEEEEAGFREALEETSKRYEEQLKIISSVAQQGIEVARRGNEVIERNNIVMQGMQASNEKLYTTITELSGEIKELKDCAAQTSQIDREIYTEVLRLKDAVKEG